MAVDRSELDRWLRAAAFHDAVKDAPRSFLREIAPDAWGLDKLRHGPAAAELARRDGEKDQGVLDAVHYHSVGYARWDRVGRMLYMADYLEPGRRHQPAEIGDLADRVPSDPDGALCCVARLRVGHHVTHGHPLLPETVAFWNALACGE
jgi:2-amino-4-hydroxy-6-hydroxymethyldihydropteridine diphosphokinase